MSLRLELSEKLKSAMKAGDDSRKQTYRLLLASIKLADVEKGVATDDAGILSIVQKEIKMRHESIEGATKAGRADLIAQSEAEIKILQEFLPKQLSDDELETIVRDAIHELNVTAPNQTGLVMKTVMPKVQGRAAGDKISKMVRDILAESSQ
jgi:uncharacterized protein YqeY